MSRAARSLFLLHFKRMVVPLLGVSALLFLASLLTIWILKSVWHVEGGGKGLDVVCLGALLAMALPVGTAPFSRAFKEQHILFFHSLPLTRSAAWWAMVGGAFGALAATTIALAVVRPGAFAVLSPQDMTLYAVAMVITFAIGAAAGLAFVRPVAVYVGAYLFALLILVGGVLGILGPALMLDYTPRALTNITIDTMAGVSRYEPPAAIWWIMAALSAAAFLAASHVFYVRGEMTHGRRRLLNPLILVGIVAVLDLLAAPLLVQAFAARSSYQPSGHNLSPDGRHAALVRRGTSVPWLATVEVTDLTTGRRRATLSADGITIGPLWMARDRIALVRRDLRWWHRPPFSMTQRDRLEIYAPDGRLLSQSVLDDETVRDTDDRANGPQLLGLLHGDRARLVEWSPDGTLRELARADGIGTIMLGRGGAWASHRTGRAHFWVLAGGGATDVPIQGASEGMPAVVEGTVYASTAIAVKEIERTMPAPRAAGERALYSLRGWFRGEPSLVAVVPHPARRVASLLMHAPGAWKTISDAIPIRDGEVFRGGDEGVYQNDLSAVSIARASGVVTYIARSGGEDVAHLFDMSSGKDFELMRRPPGDDTTCYAFLLPSGDYAVGIFSGPGDQRRVAGEIIYRNGAIEPLERRGDGPLEMLLADGTQIRRMRGYAVSVAPPNGPVRVVSLK